MTKLDGLRSTIERLATIERASCSPGEAEAADWIAAALRARGAEAHVEEHRVHGTYWWPLGIPAALGLAGAVAGARGRRLIGAGVGGLATALVVDDLGAGARWLRRLLPKQVTSNVVASMGESEAARTVIVVAHHDAAHTAVFFHPRIAAFLGRHVDRGSGEPPAELPVNMPLALGPALAALAALTGSRRLIRFAALVCAGIIASFAEIARGSTVPGANDNLTGVAVLVALADALAERPVAGLHVRLISTGAEEALMEGMRAFAKPHLTTLDPATTYVLCVDSVGSPHLVLAEAEGMLKIRNYDAAFKRLVAECAAELGVPLRRGMTLRLGTDGYLALRHGMPAALLMSVDDYGAASNYHWPTDTPDRVDYATLGDAARLCEAVVRRLAAK